MVLIGPNFRQNWATYIKSLNNGGILELEFCHDHGFIRSLSFRPNFALVLIPVISGNVVGLMEAITLVTLDIELVLFMDLIVFFILIVIVLAIAVPIVIVDIVKIAILWCWQKSPPWVDSDF